MGPFADKIKGCVEAAPTQGSNMRSWQEKW
jgi:hypothetical protein